MVLKRRQSSQDYSAEHYSEYDVVDDYRNSMCDNVFSGDGDANGKAKAGTQNSNVKKYIWVVQYVVFFLVALNAWRMNDNLFKTGVQLSQVNTDYTYLEDTISFTEIELKLAHEEFEKLKSSFQTVRPNVGLGLGVDRKAGRKAVSDTLVGLHDAQAQRIVNLQTHIQQIHLEDLRSRFGNGPYKIEVEVLVQGQRKVFTIETAPIELMPHAIHTFMDLVVNDVWKSTMFIHKVEHVVLAAPIDVNGNQKSPDVAKKLLFPEYSQEFPHVEHTVGFQGRPGGPEIYINLDDNSDYHGPGGQQQHDLVEEADPCFAKVVTGFEVLREFAEMNRKARTEDQVFYSEIIDMRVKK